MTDQMDIDHPDDLAVQHPNQPHHQQQQKPLPPNRELTTCTIKSPPFAYVHLSTPPSLTSSTTTTTIPPSQPQTQQPEETTTTIDPLQIRSYCTTALRQFLGEHGASILPDILLIRNKHSSSNDGVDVYLRLAREDLPAFAAAITAFSGVVADKSSGGLDGGFLLLQVRACGDWLGGLIGKGSEGGVWGGSS